MFELWLMFGNPDVELDRFPPHAVVSQWQHFAYEHVWYVKSRELVCYDMPRYPDYYQEACERRQVWALLYYAGYDPFPDSNDVQVRENIRTARMDYLRQLREKLGEEWFRLGIMPAPAPFLDDVWRTP